MSSTEIKLKIVIDGKEANASLQLTEANIKELYQSFKYGKQEVNGLTTAISQGFNNAREIFQGVRETFDVLRSTLAEPVKAGAQLEVLRDNFKGSKEDLENFKQAVAGTVSEAGLIKLSNQATDLGLSLQQQTLLFSLAEDAGDKYGGSLEENFQKIVFASEGSSKGLKALGIQKEIYESIVNDLAKAQGTTIENLDAESQKQIRLQAILQASGITIEDVKNKTADNADTLEQTSVAYEELQASVGESINKGFLPLLKALLDMWKGLNDIHPAITTTIGLVGTLSTAFISLKVTGITGTVSAIFTSLIPAFTALRTSLAAIHLALGPAGWLALGLSAIAALWLAVAGNAEKAARAKLDYKNASADQIRAEINELVKEKNAIQAENDLMKEDGVSWIERDSYNKNIKKMLDKDDEIERLVRQIESMKKGNNNDTPQIISKIGGKTFSAEKIENVPAPETDYKKYLDEEIKHKERVERTLQGLPQDSLGKEFGDKNEYARLSAEQEILIWQDKEYAKVSAYANAEELRKAIDAEADLRKQEAAQKEIDLEQYKQNTKLSIVSNALGQAASFLGKHTAAYKTMSIAQATIDTYKGANAALSSAPPPFNIISAAVVVASGLANVAKIISTDTGMKGYAKGGVIVGESGMEVIAPAQDYAQGWAQIISQTRNATENALMSGSVSNNNSIISELRELKKAIIERPVRAYFDNEEALKVYDFGESELRYARL